MRTLHVELKEKSYPIYIGSGLLKKTELLQKHVLSKQVLIVTNTTVEKLYLQQLKQSLEGYQLECVVLPDGEQYKNLEYLNSILTALLEHKFSRNCTVIALGGGVVGDMGGFAAACYQRGVPFIQIPTTLLAQVDSSVGGKTAVNHALGKNMIGAFYQPKCVISDTTVLETLDFRQLKAGIAEIIKYGLIRDIALFEWLENNIELLLKQDNEALSYIIERSCINKAEIVTKDEFESGLRATLNFGHTFGHAIETGMGYGEYLHGEAVAIGMCIASELSHQSAYINSDEVDRVISLIKRAELPIQIPGDMTFRKFVDLMSVDKKNVDGQMRFILLKKLGSALLPLDVPISLLKSTLSSYGQ